MTGVLAVARAGYGTYLAYTAVVFSWRGLRPVPLTGSRHRRRRLSEWMTQAGLGDARPGDFAVTVGVLFVLSAVLAYLLFGGPLPALVAGVFGATLPIASYRSRRRKRLEVARESWPRLLEGFRLLTGSLGRSIPQALFEVGRRVPEELRPAFRSAEREWLLTTDFDRTLAALRQRLAEPTADVICEILAVANEVGGTDLNQRLAELAEDRALDLQGRKDTLTKQSGVRFARLFVLLVPLGMALAGLSIGAGRSSYQTAGGQLAVAAGLLAIVACWAWSSRLLQLPEEPRVFSDPEVVAARTSPPGGAVR